MAWIMQGEGYLPGVWGMGVGVSNGEIGQTSVTEQK